MSRRFKHVIFEILTIASSLGMICWLISDFFGGMFLFLIAFGFLIIPILIIYVFSLLETIWSSFKFGIKNNKIKIIAHCSVILSIVVFNLIHSEIFKSKVIYSAILKDDLCHYKLVFRENGNVENQISGMLGFSETFYGEYNIEGDEIHFSKKPYDNNFIPDTLLIDLNQEAIFIEKTADGQFNTKKNWLNHFEIE